MTAADRWEPERSWARQQLEEAEVGEREAATVMAMLEPWWGSAMVTGDDVWGVLDAVASLARGKALEPPSQREEVWEQAKPGGVVMRDRVRVRLDAYENPRVGGAHNGRTGTVVGIRYGDIIVRYDGAPAEQTTRHPALSLEKRVK